jgi:hypothetical protein
VENSTAPMPCDPGFVSARGSTNAGACYPFCADEVCSEFSTGCSLARGCECLDGFSGATCSDFLFPDMPAANPCIVQGFDICAVDTLLASKTISADYDGVFGLHCDCSENKDFATAGVHLNSNSWARFVYDAAAKAFRITAPGCGSGPYQLCAFSGSPGVKWQRENLTASAGASTSCTWDIVASGVADVELRVSHSAATPELRGAVLGTDFAVWPPWRNSAGVFFYAYITTRKAPSDQALWSVKTKTTVSLSARLDSYCASHLSTDLVPCPCGMRWNASTCVAGGADSVPPNATCMPGAVDVDGSASCLCRAPATSPMPRCGACLWAGRCLAQTLRSLWTCSRAC